MTGNDTDRDLLHDDPVTEAFDKIDHAYDEIELAVELEVDSPPEAPRQTVVPARQPEAPPPRSTETTGSRCGVAFSPGDRIGKYELQEKIGHGTFGVVHAARDTDLDRRVALKLLNPSHNDNGDILQRFVQEARAAARVSHAGIVTILESGRYQLAGDLEVAYIAMERLEGESLGSRLKRCGRMAPTTVAEIGRQIASALHAAHEVGVLHRDLKPDNIYLVPDTAVVAGERVKVLDFGLAKLANASTTAINNVFGTPRYMSPEQCRSSGLIDARSDIYALGCILFELLTGRTPFEGEVYKILEKHLTTPAPRARTLAPEVPLALDDLINRMLAKDLVSRPASMGEVEAQLRHAGAITPGAAETLVPGTLAPLVQVPPLYDEEDVTRARERFDANDLDTHPRLGAFDPIVSLAAPRIPKTGKLRRGSTTTCVIHPLQRRRSWVGPVVALAVTVAIGIALGMLASSHHQTASIPAPAQGSVAR